MTDVFDATTEGPLYDQEQVTIGWSPSSVRNTHFTKARWKDPGYDVAEVEDFRARIADELALQQRRITQLEAQLRSQTSDYDGDYKFPEAEIAAAMDAQLAMEESYQDFLRWRTEAIEQVQAQLESMRDQIPPSVDINDLVGSFMRKQQWIDRHQAELTEQARQLMPVLEDILKIAKGTS